MFALSAVFREEDGKQMYQPNQHGSCLQLLLPSYIKNKSNQGASHKHSAPLCQVYRKKRLKKILWLGITVVVNCKK